MPEERRDVRRFDFRVEGVGDMEDGRSLRKASVEESEHGRWVPSEDHDQKLKEQEERCERLEEALRNVVLLVEGRREHADHMARAYYGTISYAEWNHRRRELDGLRYRLDYMLARTALQHSPKDEGADRG